MEQIYNVLLYGVLLMLFLIPMKIIMWKVIDETQAKAILGYGILSFVIYAVAMSATVYAVCRNVATVEECVQRMLVTFLVGNVIVLFCGFLTYCLKQRRGISELEKVKLKDM